MNRKGITLLELLVIIVVIGLLAALLLPSGRHGHCNRSQFCKSNLLQLYTVGTIHAAQHKGQRAEPKGENYWFSFTKTTPPLIGADHRSILACPVRDEELESGQCDYRGPIVPWKQLKPTDPIAADRPGNHGPGEPVYVLFKDGRVMEVALDDPRWKQWDQLLEP